MKTTPEETKAHIDLHDKIVQGCEGTVHSVGTPEGRQAFWTAAFGHANPGKRPTEQQLKDLIHRYTAYRQAIASSREFPPHALPPQIGLVFIAHLAKLKGTLVLPGHRRVHDRSSANPHGTTVATV